MGRAVLFKSEDMLHQALPTQGFDNYAITVYFNQIVDKPAKPHPIPEDWSMFISIASYRDNQLVYTLNSMIELATHPERLRIMIYDQ